MIKFILVPLIIVGVAGAIFFYFTDPVIDEIKTLRAEQGQLNNALENAKRLRQVKDDLLAVRNSFAPEDLEKMSKLLPDRIDNVRLIIDINGIAASYGMSIKNIKISAEEDVEGQISTVTVAVPQLKRRSLDFAFSVSGSYTTFKSFLADLARSLRVLDLNGLSFTPTAIGSTGDAYIYQVELKTYWLE